RRVLRRAGRCRAGGGRAGDVFAGRRPGIGLPLPGAAVSEAFPVPAPGPVPAPPHAQPVPFLRSAKAVFDLALEGMLWSRRSVAVLVLLLLPVLFGVLYRVLLPARLSARIPAADLYGVVVAFFYVRNALPLVALFYASSLIADEVESK